MDKEIFQHAPIKDQTHIDMLLNIKLMREIKCVYLITCTLSRPSEASNSTFLSAHASFFACRHFTKCKEAFSISPRER